MPSPTSSRRPARRAKDCEEESAAMLLLRAMRDAVAVGRAPFRAAHGRLLTVRASQNARARARAWGMRRTGRAGGGVATVTILCSHWGHLRTLSWALLCAVAARCRWRDDRAASWPPWPSRIAPAIGRQCRKARGAATAGGCRPPTDQRLLRQRLAPAAAAASTCPKGEAVLPRVGAQVGVVDALGSARATLPPAFIATPPG